MPIAKLVGYALLVNVGLVAALDTIQVDDPEPGIEVGDYTDDSWDVHSLDPPPDEDVEDIGQQSMRIDITKIDPALARAQAIEAARSSCLLGAPDSEHLARLLDETNVSSGFENGRAYGLEIEPTLPRRAVRLGRITSVGELDRTTIRRYMNRHIDEIESCYERELLERPAIEGTIVVQFVILPTGAVKDARGDGFDATVARCVGHAVGTIAFPRPRDGIVQVSYPLTFRVRTMHTPQPRA